MWPVLPLTGRPLVLCAGVSGRDGGVVEALQTEELDELGLVEAFTGVDHSGGFGAASAFGGIEQDDLLKAVKFLEHGLLGHCEVGFLRFGMKPVDQ